MDIPAILTRKYSGTEWVLNGDDYSGLEWLSDGEKPPLAELEALWPTVVAEIDAEKKAREDARMSAIGKLKKLGLTVDEVSAAFGIEV